MPEKQKNAENDSQLQSLKIFHRGCAIVSAAEHRAREIGINPDEIGKIGVGWNDRYYASIKVSEGPPPWQGYLNLYKVPDYIWCKFNTPICEDEERAARNISGDRIGIMLGKIANANFLKSKEINSSIWWKTAEGKDLHAPADGHFTKTMETLLTHLTIPPDISFLYFPLPDIIGDKTRRYERNPFHLPPEYINAYL